MAVQQRFLILPIIPFVLAASCGRDSQARADTTADSMKVVAGGNTRFDSAAGYVVASEQDSVRRRDSLRPDTTRAASSARPDSGRADSTAVTARDTQPAAVLSVTMAPGRPKRD